mmetsp:Transcript_12493/g.18149  ORF Transcript_12493/g.18149 Transcript_12493/m.18149 type:complete len:88 (-) Transcript_12493:64-327(-)
MMCEDKGVPFVWVSSRELLGSSCSLRGAVAAVAILSDPRSPLEGRIRSMKTRIDMLGIQLAQSLNHENLDDENEELEQARKNVLQPL